MILGGCYLITYANNNRHC